MLFKRRHLEGIVDGSVDLAFRRWERASVRPGTRLRTALGVIEILAVDTVPASAITAADARRSGHASRAELLREIRRQRPGRIHRIELRYGGADQRVELRQRSEFAPGELDELRSRLDAMDSRSSHGPWTRATLALIRDRPATLAAELAARLGRDKRPFKADVRKLKELGLTESLERGYRLSPRGQTFLQQDSAP